MQKYEPPYSVSVDKDLTYVDLIDGSGETICKIPTWVVTEMYKAVKAAQ
jgi:hypothetical protein